MNPHSLRIELNSILSLGFTLFVSSLGYSAEVKDFEVINLKAGTRIEKPQLDTLYFQKLKLSRSSADELFRDQGIPVIAQLPSQLELVKTTSWHKVSSPVDFKCNSLVTEGGLRSLYFRTQFSAQPNSSSIWKSFNGEFDPPIGDNVKLKYSVGCGQDLPDLLQKTLNHNSSTAGFFSHINYDYSDYYETFIMVISASLENGFVKMEASVAYAYKPTTSWYVKSTIEGRAAREVSYLIRKFIKVEPSASSSKGNWKQKSQ